MADFCLQCSLETFGQDAGDLANITTPTQDKQRIYANVLCEGCGPIQVNSSGRCMSPCSRSHNKSLRYNQPRLEPLK